MSADDNAGRQSLSGRVLVQDPGFRMDDVKFLLSPVGMVAQRVEGELASDAAVALLTSDDYELSVSDLDGLPALRVIVSASVGFEHLPLEAARSRGIWVCNTPGFCTTEVADTAIAHILGLLRGTVLLDRDVRRGGWDRRAAGELRRLSSTRLGIVGYGRIGRAVARRARALGLEVWATDMAPPAVSDSSAEMRFAELDEVLSECDVVSLHLPLDPTRPPLIGRRELDLMPDGAMLVNTSRGGLIDLPALVDALDSGRLRAAALDVLPTEPPTPDADVRAIENLVLTPHAAGFSSESEREAFELPIRAVLALATGSEPDGVIVRGRPIEPTIFLPDEPEPARSGGALGGRPPVTDEGLIAVRGGNVWYRSVGHGDTALLVLHGGPGVPHDYLTTHDALAEPRRVVYYDQLGCGRSDRPEDASLWTVERFVEELSTVREALGLDEVHLLGQSWGGCLAIAYLLTQPEGVKSTILSSGPASAPRYAADSLALKKALPVDVLDQLERHERNGWYDCLEYQATLMVYNQRHLCRLPELPEQFHQAMSARSSAVYRHMWGSSEWHVTGVLKDWDMTERLGEISVPVLLLAGRYDMCTPQHMTEMHERFGDSQLHVFERSSHMPFFEEPESYLAVVAGFLGNVEWASQARD